MPKACKEVFHPCAIETMHIIIFLLVVTQFLTTNIWHGSMDAALVGAIMRALQARHSQDRGGRHQYVQKHPPKRRQKALESAQISH